MSTRAYLAGLLGACLGALVGWPLGLWLYAAISDPIDLSAPQSSTHGFMDDWRERWTPFSRYSSPGERGLVGPPGEPGLDPDAFSK